MGQSSEEITCVYDWHEKIPLLTASHMAGIVVLAHGLGDHLFSLLQGPVSVPSWVSSQHGRRMPGLGGGGSWQLFVCICWSETALCLAQIESGEEIDPHLSKGDITKNLQPFLIYSRGHKMTEPCLKPWSLDARGLAIVLFCFYLLAVNSVVFPGIRLLPYQKPYERHFVMPIIQVWRLRHNEVKTLTEVLQTVRGGVRI